MNYIKEICFRWSEADEHEYYSKIEALKNTNKLIFKTPVTFFVGENGSGKSTLLEGIAIAYGFNAEGGSLNYNFATKNTHSSLNKYLTLSRSFYKPKDGFFLRAESFYNFASELERLTEEDTEIKKNQYLSYYGSKSLHQQSHGESFLSLVQNRFRGNGIYFLDEPEAALSPQRQLTLLAEIISLVKNGAQLIIATHSPILLSAPNATIYTFDTNEIIEIPYEETESYQVTKLFINNRESILKELLSDYLFDETTSN